MIDIPATLAALALRRPIFHSEADFQHALAWEIHQRWPDHEMRLEYRPPHADTRMYVDVWIAGPEGTIAIELKYKTRKLEITHGGEHFSLMDHSAQDLGRYDFLKDIQRLERVALSRPDAKGYAILLTNDRAYWGLGQNRTTVDTSFRLHHGRELAGELGWGAGASAGTMRSREQPIILRGPYTNPA